MLSNQANSTNWCSQQWTSITRYGKFTFWLDTNRIRGKKGSTSTFNQLIFDNPIVVPKMKVKCTARWTKHRTCLTCRWSNLCNTEAVISNTQLLHSKNYYTIFISISCWILQIWTGSCFKSNCRRFRIGTWSIFKLVIRTTKLGVHTFTPM